MQARRAARELAFILFSQLDKDLTKYSDTDFEDIILKSVRILTNTASEELKVTTSALFEIREFINDYEANHTINLERPIAVFDIPVQIPMTSDMIGRIDELLNASEKAMIALEIAEMTALQEGSVVKDYIRQIVSAYKTNNIQIDELIQKYSNGWDISRLVKMDKDILRIALSEMLFIKDAPLKVVIDEAVELTKKYSTEDSPSFVNGILGKIALENDLV